MLTTINQQCDFEAKETAVNREFGIRILVLQFKILPKNFQ